MTEKTGNAVELRDYGFQYETAEVPVLEHVDLRLAYGELAVLAGPSGAGKSTLLFSLNGVIPNFTSGRQSGDIIVDGVSVRGQRIAALSHRVGSVLQNAELQIVHDRVEDEIAFACENLKFPPERIAERIRFGCEQMELSPAGKTRTLSGGQKQRLITATTLAMGQRILLLDEPLANLDIAGAHRLMDALSRLARGQGYCVLVVEHRLDLVLPYADRVLWMERRTVREIPRGEKPPQEALSLPERAAAPPGPCLLKADRLRYTAGTREILKDISLEIHENERIVILGENGCGKTTLLRLLSGLAKPAGGAVSSPLISGRGRQRIGSAAWFRHAGVVEQNPDYQLFMPTVEQELCYKAVSAQRAEALMQSLGLAELRGRHPQSLSEGQKRRTSLAAILAMEPEILLLDEPTVGQDSASLRTMAEELCRLSDAARMAQVVVTHDRAFAQAFADRVLWLRDGVIFREGGKEVCEEYFDAMRTAGRGR